MTQEEFNVVFELQMRKCADILAHKKKEYTGDNIDRLGVSQTDVLPESYFKTLDAIRYLKSRLSIAHQKGGEQL